MTKMEIVLETNLFQVQTPDMPKTPQIILLDLVAKNTPAILTYRNNDPSSNR